MARNQSAACAVFGVDLGKNVFHIVGQSASGETLIATTRRRDTILAFFEKAAPAIVAMEACPGAQWLARKLAALGHEPRIIPAKFVKPFIKSNKSDIIDASAIAEAATRPNMRFAALRSPEQSDLQSLHRIRSQMVSNKTRLINQMRAFCLEYGVGIRKGAGVFRLDLPRVIADASNDLTPTIRRLLASLFEDFMRMEKRINEVTREIKAVADEDERTRRLMTIPGVGPLAATAIIAAIGDVGRFKKARDLAAWLGLVPREYSTGGKQTLLGISKRGNSYIRRLLIHGARSCVLHLNRTRDGLGGWLDQLSSRMHRNKVVVALAAKIARMIWAVLAKPGNSYMRKDPMATV